MWPKALEIASRLTLPIPVVAFALVFAVFAYALALRSRKREVSRLFLAVLVAVVILGVGPLLSSTYLQSRNVYRISVKVLGLDKQPARDAELTSLPTGQIKKADGSWEVEIPPQTRPADGMVALTAAVPDAYLEGIDQSSAWQRLFPDGHDSA